MAGGPVHDKPNPARHLSVVVTPVRTLLIHPTVKNSRLPFRQRELRINLVEVLPHHEVNTETPDVNLFARLGKENQVAVQGPRPSASASSMTIRFAVRVVLVVECAAPPDVTVFDHRTERVHGPLLSLHTDDVSVSHQ